MQSIRNFFTSFTDPAKIIINLDNEEEKPKAPLNPNNPDILAPIYHEKDVISGNITILPSTDLEHEGVKVELISEIIYDEEKNKPNRVLQAQKDLLTAGTMTEAQTFEFLFPNVDKPYETYHGLHIQLRYFIRVTITRAYKPKIIEEKDFLVHLFNKTELPPSVPVRMQVGIEDLVHIEFVYDKSQYSLNDVVLGEITFVSVKVDIENMEIWLMKREKITDSNQVDRTYGETISKFEVMAGTPVFGEVVPIRMYLTPHEKKLTPTMTNVNGVFDVKYFLNLLIFDKTADDRYFRSQEIELFRIAPETKQNETEEIVDKL
eukprot:TRINITY_DN3281_c1_g1_i1.p1 TRINITY_DN3281_c1_g1~~TRINITY_DN3281_c1_g1_i1.p1  ORF type:complete len:329 (+),score=93.69 TRINITY_DN3281_c1_g1_i1:33-989(+)